MTSSNSREARQSIKPMINVPHQGRGKASLNLQVSEGLEIANQLNTPFCCFDSGSRNDCPVELPSSPTPPLDFITESKVLQVFGGCKPPKSSDPDNVCGSI